MARIELQDVSKVYTGGVRAVNALSLDIPDGDFMVFVGPSGCGKSTALRNGGRAGGHHRGRDPHRRPGGE